MDTPNPQQYFSGSYRPDKLSPKQVSPHRLPVPQKYEKHLSETSGETFGDSRHAKEHASGQNRVLVRPVCRTSISTRESSIKKHLIQGHCSYDRKFPFNHNDAPGQYLTINIHDKLSAQPRVHELLSIPLCPGMASILAKAPYSQKAYKCLCGALFGDAHSAKSHVMHESNYGHSHRSSLSKRPE
ncbi:hypothetical protein M422DRAFT_250023 [Sphaerobolus stellatus SS14]|nr:hypothetical protein M422DRAFT_250023 [Sphaerobolus stellatus SS14]